MIKFKSNRFFSKLLLGSFILLGLSVTCFPQQEKDSTNVYQAFTNYTSAAREVAYAHLNKSVYSKGETLAFTVYVIEKDTKRPSEITRNLYAVITDEEGNIIKGRLILINNGVGHGSFFVDESLSEGNYTFKAFTNYMKNFDEQNYYIQNFRVLQNSDETVEDILELDAQFLAEGGHLVEGVSSSVGVVVKDETGSGVGNLTGIVYDRNNEEITNFKTDLNGIGRFLLTPEAGNFYKAVIDYYDEPHSFNLPLAEKRGIVMSLVELGSRIALQFKTNDATLNQIKGQPYVLTFHDGEELKSFPFEFENENSITKFINDEDLFTGINVFTLFDGQDRPLLERIYFNYNGLEMLTPPEAKIETVEDSLQISLDFTHLIAVEKSEPKVNPKPKSFQDALKSTMKSGPRMTPHNFSISVLPASTVAYNHSHNIFSYFYLQPYIKGYVQNAAYYFKDVTPEKQRQLDNLLLTQGWSSYNWNNIFNQDLKYLFPLELGITANINLNEEPYEKYMIAVGRQDFRVITTNDSSKVIKVPTLFPIEGESFYVSGLTKSDRTRRPSLYVTFTPSKIPEFENHIKLIPNRRPNLYTDLKFDPIIMNSWTGIEQLDEIVLSVKKRDSKREELQATTTGTIDDFKGDMRQKYFNFANYLRSKGFQVDTNFGQFVVTSPRVISTRAVSPAFYLDDVRILDPTIFNQLDVSIIDFVVVDENNSRVPGTTGVIRVYTDPSAANVSGGFSQTVEADFPIGFSANKMFYAPRYGFYQNSFFKDYGVVDWIPRARVDAEGMVKFRFRKESYPTLRLYIEGTLSDRFMSQEIDVNLETQN
ncbi:MAG: hypothetical protein R3213_04010 [Flavobacteriaceae bacterium]|nr:hypothetical protein [Flavobacteriaceae bacterium]